jgi:hypothetical protein
MEHRMTLYTQADSTTSCFASRLPFTGRGCGALAVFCSDGRFASQINDFLQNGLQLHGCDRLVLAGGPGCLAGHFTNYRAEEGATAHLQFLARVHHLDRLILVAHDDCGFYRHFLGINEKDLLNRIKSDIRTAAFHVRGAAPQLKIEGYIARLRGAEVWFEPVAA